MDLLDLPVAGQWSVLGILIGLVVFFIVQDARGDRVPRKQVDQVQKTADMWQQAWETAMTTQASTAVTLERLTTTLARVDVLADTMEHVLGSLPRLDDEEGRK